MTTFLEEEYDRDLEYIYQEYTNSRHAVWGWSSDSESSSADFSVKNNSRHESNEQNETNGFKKESISQTNSIVYESREEHCYYYALSEESVMLFTQHWNYVTCHYNLTASFFFSLSFLVKEIYVVSQRLFAVLL